MRTAPMRRLVTSSRGSAVAEFIVVLPILLAYLFAAVILGRGMATKMAVMSAARVAAREYATTGSQSRAIQATRDEMAGAGFAVTADNPQVQLSGGTMVTATVTYRVALPSAGSTLPGVPKAWDFPGRAAFRR